jgi:hypothetical protein
VIPDKLDHTTQGELQRYENNYKTINLITTALGRNLYDRVSHLETAHDVWLKLCNTYEGSTRLSLRKVESPLMIALLALNLLLAAYVHVILLLILIMNMLNNYCMLLMTLCGA